MYHLDLELPILKSVLRVSENFSISTLVHSFILCHTLKETVNMCYFKNSQYGLESYDCGLSGKYRKQLVSNGTTTGHLNETGVDRTIRLCIVSMFGHRTPHTTILSCGVISKYHAVTEPF